MSVLKKLPEKESFMEGKELRIPGYEKVVEATLTDGHKAIIAVHNTKLGPSLGGLRFFPYQSEEEALTDVLRLAEGMTYKSALANLPLGGGKSVIIGDPKKIKSVALLESMGEFVDSLNGLYITAKDVGIEIEDLDVISHKTKYVRGTSFHKCGDPSPVTAYGVYKGMKAAAKYRWGDESLKGKKVVIQGLGHVGYSVAKLISDEGAEIAATDLSPDALQKAKTEFGIKALSTDAWENEKADIFCPCAMGAIVNKQSIPFLVKNGVQIVAGGANNQLLNFRKDGQRLRDAHILYAPDFVINAGGIINVYCDLNDNYSHKEAIRRTGDIYDILLQIFERADRENTPTAIIANDMAREKVRLK